MPDSGAPRWRKAPPAWFLLSCIPVLALAVLMARYAFDVPYYDDWAMLPLIEECLGGRIPWAGLIARHNEHRPVLSKVVLLLVAIPTRWQLRWAEPAVLLFAVAAFWAWVVAWLGSVREKAIPYGAWLVPVAALLFFSPAQWHTWLTGWMLHSPMLLFFTFMSFAALTVWRQRAWAFPAALAAAFAATFTVASGLLVWPLGFFAMLPDEWRACPRYRLSLWIIAALVAIALFHGGSAVHPSVLPRPELPRDILIMARHAVVFLGGPVAGFHPLPATGAGILGLSGLVAVVTGRLRRDGLGDPSVRFFLLLVGFGIGSALLTAWGRALDPAGPAQAVSSRYLTFAMPFWMGLLPLMLMGVGKTGSARVALLLGMISIMGVSMGAYGIYRADERWDAIQLGRKALVNDGPDHDLMWLHPDPARVRDFNARLKRHRLGLYNNTPETNIGRE
jgi:hypothetical protein